MGAPGREAAAQGRVGGNGAPKRDAAKKKYVTGSLQDHALRRSSPRACAVRHGTGQRHARDRRLEFGVFPTPHATKAMEPT